MAEHKVNCRVHNLSDGSKQLVFTVEGTSRCVGEIRLACDENYLVVISKLFSQYAAEQRGRLPASVHQILNGKRRVG